MMLYEFLITNDDEFDTYDTEFGVVVTVSIDLEGETDYDKFCNALCKKIEITDYTCCGDPICDWSGYIKRNLPVFRRFADDNWIKNNYRDEDLFVAEWIEQLHLYLAGYGVDDDYGWYKEELVDKCN